MSTVNQALKKQCLSTLHRPTNKTRFVQNLLQIFTAHNKQRIQHAVSFLPQVLELAQHDNMIVRILIHD